VKLFRLVFEFEVNENRRENPRVVQKEVSNVKQDISGANTRRVFICQASKMPFDTPKQNI
jgi:hypothetical protein